MCFLQLKKGWTIRKTYLRTKIRIFEATLMTVVKFGSDAWAIGKTEEDLLDVCQKSCLRNGLGSWLSDRISNSRLYEKCRSILLSKAIMRGRLGWLGHVLRMKDDSLPAIVLFGQPSRIKRKTRCHRLGRRMP